jgi:predicted nucleic acid-binding Zn ribbon protein
MTEQERRQCYGIDINGLSLCDRDRIEEVGFNAWLEEISKPNAAGAQVSRLHHRKICAACESVFLAIRDDAKYCSHSCQLRSNRRGLAFRGLLASLAIGCNPQSQ